MEKGGREEPSHRLANGQVKTLCCDKIHFPSSVANLPQTPGLIPDLSKRLTPGVLCLASCRPWPVRLLLVTKRYLCVSQFSLSLPTAAPTPRFPSHCFPRAGNDLESLKTMTVGPAQHAHQVKGGAA